MSKNEPMYRWRDTGTHENYPEFMNSFSDVMIKAVRVSGEDIANLSKSIKEIRKVGVRIPITWEAIAEHPRTGSYEPTGNKYTQWMTWWFGKQLFRYWKFVERWLNRFRHFEGVGGYDWEDAEYRDFEQRKEWRE